MLLDCGLYPSLLASFKIDDATLCPGYRQLDGNPGGKVHCLRSFMKSPSARPLCSPVSLNHGGHDCREELDGSAFQRAIEHLANDSLGR